MRILMWHVHGSWATSFLQGGHDYLLPVQPDRGPYGRGRAQTWDWPASAVEVAPADLAGEDVDVVVLQRPEEVALAGSWLSRRPGVDVPAVYLEHNTPEGDVPCTRHPMADQSAIPVVHVTGFNELMWDNGEAPTTVIEHGIIDPGHRYSGEVERAAVAVNEPVRRGRFVGTDLIRQLGARHGIDVFGMGVTPLGESGAIRTYEDLPQHRLHEELPQRRLYLHTTRWTSLGLSLLEAMALGMPVVAVGTTMAPYAVPPEAGATATRVEDLSAEISRLLGDPGLAAQRGAAAREHVLEHHSLERFLASWDELLQEVAG
jgi:glycosyltransferase involved in cell wall biosynthesis